MSKGSKHSVFKKTYGYSKRIANIMKRDGITDIEEYRRLRNEKKKMLRLERAEKSRLNKVMRSKKSDSKKQGKK